MPLLGSPRYRRRASSQSAEDQPGSRGIAANRLNSRTSSSSSSASAISSFDSRRRRKSVEREEAIAVDGDGEAAGPASERERSRRRAIVAANVEKKAAAAHNQNTNSANNSSRPSLTASLKKRRSLPPDGKTPSLMSAGRPARKRGNPDSPLSASESEDLENDGEILADEEDGQEARVVSKPARIMAKAHLDRSVDSSSRNASAPHMRDAEDIAADALCGALEPDSAAKASSSQALRVRTSPANASADDNSADASSEAPAEELQGAVEVEGIWNPHDEVWAGNWFQVDLPELDAPFEYRPLPGEVDADMVDMPCELCKGSDPEGFLFCDLCDRGFHVWCCGLSKEPAPDEDWHCKSCTAVLKRFKQKLPPSRRWSGWFRMSKKAHLKGYQYKETFKIHFDYSTEYQQHNLIAKFTGKGRNRLGDFRFAGKMTYEGGKVVLRARKSYFQEQVKRKRSPATTSGISRKREKLADSSSTADPVDLRTPTSTSPSWGQAHFPAPGADVSPANGHSQHLQHPPNQAGAANSATGAAASSAPQPSGPPSAAAAAAAAAEDHFRVDPSDPRQITMALSLLSRELHRLRGPKTTLVVTDLDCGLFLGSTGPTTAEPDQQLPLLWHFVAALPGNLQWISEVPRGALEILFRMHSFDYMTELMKRAKHDDELNMDLSAAMKACGAVALAVSSIIPNARQVPHIRMASSNVPLGSNAIVLVSPGTSRTGIHGLVSSEASPEDSSQSGDGPTAKKSERKRAAAEKKKPKFDAAPEPASSLLNYVAHGAIHAQELLRERVAVLSVSSTDRALGTAEILKNRGIFFVENYASAPMDWLEKIRSSLERIKKYQPTVIIVSQAFDVPDSVHPSIVGKLTLDLLSICTQVVSVVEESSPAMSHHLRAHIEALQAFA